MPKPQRIQAWKAELMSDRVLRCLRMLYLHGLVTEAERARIERRIEKLEED